MIKSVSLFWDFSYRTTPERLFIQWGPIFDFMDENVINGNKKSFEWYLKNYKYPDNLPNLTRKVNFDKLNIEANTFRYSDFNEFGSFIWIVEVEGEGTFYFNIKEVLLPSGEMLRFD